MSTNVHYATEMYFRKIKNKICLKTVTNTKKINDTKMILKQIKILKF